jgi:formyltetrahydrofolate-dependent phosphoribosylglycinamide formyltransferase
VSARIAVFASGGGTNLQSLLDYFGGAGREVAQVALVVSDREGAGALERARRAGVEGRVIPVRGRAVDEVAEETLGVLREGGVDVVVLAGYLRLVPPEVVRAFRGRMVNIHPALLPAFGGAGMYGINIHRAVLEAGCTVTGATVHYVDERYDTGPILLQWPVPVLADDTPETLAARVLAVEHRILPLAVEAVVQGVGRRGGGVGEPVAFGLVGEAAPAEGEVRGVLGFRAGKDNGRY